MPRPHLEEKTVSEQAPTLSSKNLSSAGTVNSSSHVTSDPDTGGTNLTPDEESIHCRRMKKHFRHRWEKRSRYLAVQVIELALVHEVQYVFASSAACTQLRCEHRGAAMASGAVFGRKSSSSTVRNRIEYSKLVSAALRCWRSYRCRFAGFAAHKHLKVQMYR